MDAKSKIIKAINRVVGIPESEVCLDVPENAAFGDYSTNIALTSFGNSKFHIPNFKFENPRELAHILAEKLRENKELIEVIENIEIAGPGFINFFLSTKYLTQNLEKVIKEAERYSTSEIGRGKKIMVEFAHPNTHKAFHIGHLRNISTGEALSRILSANGNEVIRVNYQGDVGLHIAKALWGYLNKLDLVELQKKYGDIEKLSVRDKAKILGTAYALGSKSYEEDDGAKGEIVALNRKIYSKEDKTINDIYSKTRQWSLDYFQSIYERVYTKFDRLYFESEVFDRGLQLAKEAVENGILEHSEGAIVFPGEKYGLHTRVFVSSEGNPTYEAKDLGLAEIQLKEYSPDLIAHIVASEQAGYFQVLFKALELINPETAGREKHLVYGWVRLKEGKMSSRLGNVVLGEDLIDEAKRKIIQVYKTDADVAEKIAIGAVKYSFLRTGTEQEIAFDLEESIALEGNSGPYLQYTYARTQSVLTKVRTQSVLGKVLGTRQQALEPKLIPSAQSLMPNPEELSILRTLIHFPEVVAEAGERYSPNLICNYLYDLAQKFNLFYQKHRIVTTDRRPQTTVYGHGTTEKNTVDSGPKTVDQFRLALTSAVGAVLKNGLDLLGIGAPERM